MASKVVIEKAARDNIPSNAVILSKDEAINMQWNIIYNWKPKSEVYGKIIYFIIIVFTYLVKID